MRREVRNARNVLAAMHEAAVREAVPVRTEVDLAAMRDADLRFAGALEAGELKRLTVPTTKLHNVLLTISGNRALATVLESPGTTD